MCERCWHLESHDNISPLQHFSIKWLANANYSGSLFGVMFWVEFCCGFFEGVGSLLAWWDFFLFLFLLQVFTALINTG